MPQELYIHDVCMSMRIADLPRVFTRTNNATGYLPHSGLFVDSFEPDGIAYLEFENGDTWPANWDEVRERIATYIVPGSYIVAESEGQVFKWLWENETCRTILGWLEFVEE